MTMKKLLKSIIYIIILLPLISQAQWKWLNPKPKGYNLNSVKFVNLYKLSKLVNLLFEQYNSIKFIQFVNITSILVNLLL